MQSPRQHNGRPIWHEGFDLEKANSDALIEYQLREKDKKPLSERPVTDARDWMAFMDDSTPLTMLTIPGTHDSAAYTVSYPFVTTQRLDILEQLDSGIRYFDLRCGLRNDILEMVHGPSYLGMTLHNVLKVMYKWLRKHSSEAVIVQIKEDTREVRSTVEFARAVVAVVQQNANRWRTENTVPLLGSVRGRIQLFRRFEGIDAYGLNLVEWEDNPFHPFTMIVAHDIQVTIQDHYTFVHPRPLPRAIEIKGGAVYECIKQASSNTDANHWFINFTSAFEISFRYQLTPRQIAIGGRSLLRWYPGVNPRLRATLIQMGDTKKRLGIVAMDYPEIGTDDLISMLIQKNFDLDKTSRNAFSIWQYLLIFICFSVVVGSLYFGRRTFAGTGLLLDWL